MSNAVSVCQRRMAFLDIAFIRFLSSAVSEWPTKRMYAYANANANAHRPTLRLDLTVTSGVTRGWMARGSHSFTCHPHVYPRMEWAILACIS